MKKLFIIVWMVSVIGILTACGNENSDLQNENSQSISIPQAEEDNTSQKETEKTGEDISDGETERMEKPLILSLQETRNARYEGINDFEKLLLISEFNNVIVTKYMADVLFNDNFKPERDWQIILTTLL